MIADIIELQEKRERVARRHARAFLFEWGYLPSGIEALISVMLLPASDLGESTALRLREELVGPDVAATAAEMREVRHGRHRKGVPSKTIPFPDLIIERVARQMLPVTNAPSAEQSQETFQRVVTELRIGEKGGLNLNADQWADVWRRVYGEHVARGAGQ